MTPGHALDYSIEPLGDGDRAWVRQFVADELAADFLIVHGMTFYPHDLPGFVARQGNDLIGLATYHIDSVSCEVVSLHSFKSSLGVGTALIEAVRQSAINAGCNRLWVITTNDNLNALGFYQRRGFSLVKVNRNALDATRKLKPKLPLIGMNNIPLRDELELEMALVSA
jgi:GNAT superfamily N-acetyltransferase